MDITVIQTRKCHSTKTTVEVVKGRLDVDSPELKYWTVCYGREGQDHEGLVGHTTRRDDMGWAPAPGLVSRLPERKGPGAVTTTTTPNDATLLAFDELRREGKTLGVTLTIEKGFFVFTGASGEHKISAHPSVTDDARLRAHAEGFYWVNRLRQGAAK